MNERKAKRLSERGSVSIYMILIIVPIFLFVSVFIDFARIRAADRESELAVKAGVRSVMSAFDKQLQTYGLFGQSYDPDRQLELFERAFEASLSGAVGGERFLDTQPTSQAARVTPLISLANPEEFRRQVLEEMKYRAPIEYALELTDKLKSNGMTDRFQKGRAFAEQSEQLERLLDRRETALDDAWDFWKRLYDKATDDRRYYESRLQELNSLADQIGLNTVEEVRQSLQEIGEQLRSLQQSLAGLDGTLASMAQAGQPNEASILAIAKAKEAIQRQISELAAKRSELERLLQLLLKYAALIASTKLESQAALNRVTELQTSFSEALNEAKRANDALRDEWSRIGESAGEQEQFGNVRVMPDEHFASFQAEVASVAALFGAFAGQIASTLSYHDDVYAELKGKIDAYADKASTVYGNRVSAEEQRKARNENVKASKRKQLSAIGEVLDQAKQAIGGCQTGTDGEPDRIAYERLRQLETKYAGGEATAPDAGESVTELTDARSIGTQAMKLVGLIGDAMAAVRDGSYINEFALTKFNYRTLGMELDDSGQPKPASSFSKPESHTLFRQEAEYVTYGFPSCAANIASAYGEMFAIRLAIRTIEQLTEPRNEVLQLGSPLLVLLAAVAQAAGQALLDMNKLVKGEEVPLSGKFSSAIKLSYRDYLRAMMLVHGHSAGKIIRMQSLIELNTRIDLFHVTTKLQAGAGSSVKLWFLPGAVKLLGMAGLTPCETEGGRCILFRSAAWGY